MKDTYTNFDTENNKEKANYKTTVINTVSRLERVSEKYFINDEYVNLDTFPEGGSILGFEALDANLRMRFTKDKKIDFSNYKEALNLLQGFIPALEGKIHKLVGKDADIEKITW